MSHEIALIPLLETLSDREAILVAHCNLLTQRLEEALMTDPISAQLSEDDWWETALKVRDERLHKEHDDQIKLLNKKTEELAQYNDYLLETKYRLERELMQERMAKQPPNLRVLSNHPPCTVA